MNTNPLMPGGAEQKNQGRARVKTAVFFVLAVHVVVLGALLMQGCKDETPPQGDTNTPVMDTNQPPVVDSGLPALPPPAGIALPTNAAPPELSRVEVPAATAGATVTTYKIVRGDTFDGLSKKFRVSAKAIQEANPGVEATKLQIGQEIHIPAPSTATAISSASAVASVEADANVHEVKSGDTLSGIAVKYHTTVKALRAANNLTTDRIKVGQKLKIPAGAPTPPPVEAAPAPTTPAPAGAAPIQ